ncbi:MAG: hypothetical protein AAB609_01690 [Patescibacteria group bacterium]
MAYSKTALLDKAIDIVKEYGRGGSTRIAELTLRQVYEELKRINQEIEQES